MSRYFAQIENGVVQRVIVCSNPDWLSERLGGTWIETSDPYTEGQEVAFCGPGFGLDESFPERFAPPWTPPQPDPDTGEWSSYSEGRLVFHNGRIWKSTVDGNVWEPGVSAWHDAPQGSETPQWVAPTGEHDTYPLGFVVAHNGTEWESLHEANSWEPGSQGAEDVWRDLNASEPDPDEPQPWEPWDGDNENLYQVGDRVTHNGQTWTSNTADNHWEPGVFGWDPD